jgi:hypothetical protein
VPLAVLAVVAGAYPRLRAGWRAAIALACGVLGAAAGTEAAHYTATVGPSGDDFTGLLAAIAPPRPARRSATSTSSASPDERRVIAFFDDALAAR